MAQRAMSGVVLTHRPPKQKGVLIIGYIYQAMYAGGHVRMKDLASTLVDRSSLQAPWTVASNLRRLQTELTPVFTSAEEILENHTCLPAHLPFATPGLRAKLMEHVLDGKQHKGIAAAVGLTGKAIESKPRMAMCLECIREDARNRRIAYWRREHALAGLGYCPHHGTPLYVGCGRCTFSQIGTFRPLMPRLACWCGKPLVLSHFKVDPPEGRLLTRMAGYAHELLQGALADRTAEEIGSYYHWSAHQHGYAAGSRIKSPTLALDIQRRYTPAVLSRLNASIRSERNWIANLFGERISPNVLGRNLLLFDFFGERVPGAADFEMAREHAKAASRVKRVRTTAQPSAREIEADRVVILKYFEGHPDASRTEVLRQLGRTAQRARDQDSVWYDAHLVPRPKGKRPREPERYLDALDVRTEAHVLARRQELLSFAGGNPKPITKTALLKGTPLANQITEELLERLPRTRRAIDEGVETTLAFKRRYAIAILMQPEEPGLDRVAEAQKRTGLLISDIDKLNFSITARSDGDSSLQA